MNADNARIEAGGTTIREGTAVYDTKFDRVLWIDSIDEYEISVEVATEYADDELIWWTSGDDDPSRVVDGACMSIVRFRTLLTEGRFEIGPHPVGPTISI